MAPTERERALVRRARERLDEWTYDARERAYAALFEGPDAALAAGELQLLDRIDSELTRRTGTGLWGADEYGIAAAGVFDGEGPRVVCVYHPEIPEEGYPGEESLGDAPRRDLNDALWAYAERVAAYLQDDLDEFRRAARREDEA